MYTNQTSKSVTINSKILKMNSQSHKQNGELFFYPIILNDKT